MSARHGRPGRDVVLAAALAAVLGSLDQLVEGPSIAVGLVRLSVVGILVVAVLQHRLLGRSFTISTARRGALTTAGLVVFFAVAQIAQEFLSDSLGVIVGGAAAGALVFAAMPLQRVAERLSERAAPVLAPPALPGDDVEGRERAYREAVRAALRDGVLTREEERRLLRLSHHLRISALRAVEIHDEVESASRGAPPDRA